MTNNQTNNIDTFKHAVIDVGSNSVRLVIYQIGNDHFVPIHNEKVLAGLGRGVDETGNLSPIGVELALNALRRFKMLLDALGIVSYDAIATAAARDAENGREFIEKIQNEIGLKIRLITGEEEGRLSALGVKYGAPDADGIMGDLGGSSLELVPLNMDKGLRESWHLGPLAIGERALARNFVSNIQSVSYSIHEQLDKSNVLKLPQIKEFHAVGGAWRNLAHIHMMRKNYPLQVLQNYSIDKDDAIEICNWIMLQPKRTIEKIQGISQRRADTLPFAALLLLEIIKITNCERVIISSYGLREGLIRERLSENKDYDPLISSTMGICKSRPEDIEFSYALFDWIKPIMGEFNAHSSNKRYETLGMASALLSNIGLGLHPDHRAYLTYQLVLRAPYPALSHVERVFLARTIARRYGAKTDEILSYECASLLSAEHACVADIYGAAMRLAANLTSNSAQILKQTELRLVGNKVELNLPTSLTNLYSESVRKRFDQLISAFSKNSGVTNRIL